MPDYTFSRNYGFIPESAVVRSITGGQTPVEYPTTISPSGDISFTAPVGTYVLNIKPSRSSPSTDVISVRATVQGPVSTPLIGVPTLNGVPVLTSWSAATSYIAGQWVVAPGGYLASSKTDFTSGSTYSSSNWNEFIPGAEVAYAENITGTTYTLTTTSTALAGTNIVVPLSLRPQYIIYEAWIDVTTAPAATKTGMVGINVIDDLSTIISGDIIPFEGSGDTAAFAKIKGEVRIPPNTPQRAYSLVANRSGDTVFRANILNGAIGPAFRSYIACRAA